MQLHAHPEGFLANGKLSLLPDTEMLMVTHCPYVSPKLSNVQQCNRQVHSTGKASKKEKQASQQVSPQTALHSCGGQTMRLRAAPDSPEPKGDALVWSQADGGASQPASWSMYTACLHPPCIALAAACQVHRSLCTRTYAHFRLLQQDLSFLLPY